METLPDLDSGPEVFETSDIESVENLTVTTEEATADIEQSRLDTKLAHNTFDEHTLVGHLDLVDFSGSLSAENSGRNTYHTRKWAETKSQRLARIARELAEIEGDDTEEKLEVEKLRKTLEMSVQTSGKNGYYFEKLSGAFRQAEEQLAHVKAHEKRELGGEKEEIPTEETGLPGNQKHLSYRESVLGLDSRLELLERAVGISELSSSTNLRLHLRDLDRKINVLYNPEHEIDIMKYKVSELNKELEQLAKNRRMAQLSLSDNTQLSQPGTPGTTSLFERKVDSVFSKLGEIASAKQRLPSVITRLKSLHEIHCDLASAVTTIGEFDDTLESLQRDILSWDESLDSVRTAVRQQAEAFDRKSVEIERKLADMEVRVDALL